MDRLIDWIAQVILSKHRVPTEVEGSTQVKAGGDADTIVIWSVWTNKFCLSTSGVIALSGQTQNITECLITKTCHKLNTIVTPVIDVTVWGIDCARSISHIDLGKVKNNFTRCNVVTLLIMVALSEIHGIVLVVLDFPLFLGKGEIHLRQYQLSVIAVRVLRDIKYHVIILPDKVSSSPIILL